MVDVNAAERLPMDDDVYTLRIVNAEPPPVEATEADVASCSSQNPLPPTTKAGNSSQDANEPAEQDLSEEDDDYQDTFVQRYVPGVYVDVKLKDVYRDDSGKMQRVPMVIDFFEECLKTYKDERKFIYEDSYLRTSRGLMQASVLQNGNSNPCNGQAVPGKRGDAHHLKAGCRGPAVNIAVPPPDRKGVVENGTHEVSLDDVMWMKNRPNDPLLKCIQSITDRLNIQGIVGDPTSYLKEGGDDMHYDIDDPFIDDAELYSELRMSRNDILQKGQIEKDFSVWSEEEEEEGALAIQPETFVAEYASGCDLEEVAKVETEEVIALFFNPAGWKRFHDRVPKQFRPIFKSFEESFKGFSGYLSTDDITAAVKDIMDKIFVRLTKMQEPKQKKISTIKDGDSAGADDDETDEQQQIMVRHGLNCIGVGKIIGVNGRIMRWIVRTITEMTNALSCYQLNEMWIKLVLSHNAETINQMEAAVVTKIKPKLVQLKEKRTPKYFNKMDDHLKNLSKRIGQLRKVVREYEIAIETESEQKLSRIPPNDSVESNRYERKGGNVKEESPKPSNDTTRADDLSSQERPNDDKESVVTDDTKINEEGAKVTPVRCSQSSNDNAGPPSSARRYSLPRRGPGLTMDDLKCSLSEDECRTVISEVDDNSRQYTQDDQPSPVDAQPHSDGDTTSFSGILRQSKLWKRIKDVITMYKMASTDLLTLVQMINVALATSISIGGTDFSPLVKDAINLPYVFDKAYIRLADMFSELVEEISLVKIAIPPDVSRVAVMFIHEASAIVELFECENEDPLVFCDNSKVAAPEGKVKIVGNKRSRKVPKSVLPDADDAAGGDKARQTKRKINNDTRKGQVSNSKDSGKSEDASPPKDGKATTKGDKIHGKQKSKTPTIQKERKRKVSKEPEPSGSVKTAVTKNQSPNKSQKVAKAPKKKEA